MGEPTSPAWDFIEGVPLPREQTALFGHDAATRALHEDYRDGRIHHGLILTGPRGVGKATLAFRFARFVLSYSRPEAAPAAGDAPLAGVDPRVAAQVTNGGHPNLLHLVRAWDYNLTRWKTRLTVDEIRRTVSFLGQSAGNDGWRVVIVDSADEMNPNAANALLKLLEEPPPRVLFLVLSHVPGRLLPTIRSRCRRIALRPLGEADLVAALDSVGMAPPEDEDRALVLRLAGGSVREAIEILVGEGLDLYRRFDDLAGRFPRLDRGRLHALADRIGPISADTEWRLFLGFARRWLSGRVHGEGGSLRRAGTAALAWERVEETARETERLNLDRKQAAIEIVERLAASAAD